MTDIPLERGIGSEPGKSLGKPSQTVVNDIVRSSIRAIENHAWLSYQHPVMGQFTEAADRLPFIWFRTFEPRWVDHDQVDMMTVHDSSHPLRIFMCLSRGLDRSQAVEIKDIGSRTAIETGQPHIIHRVVPGVVLGDEAVHLVLLEKDHTRRRRRHSSRVDVIHRQAKYSDRYDGYVWTV